jgi:hypothetical protein
MVSIIRKRVTYANVALTVALVFAMSGGAFAAGKFLITSTKQISPKVLKSLQGKAGAAGASGPAGAAGAAGPQGPAGPAGSKGDTGAQGLPGTPGTNGTNGTNGKEGSPWTVGGTLPSKKSESGTWALGEVTSAAHINVSISFPIKLAEPLDEKHVEIVGVGETGTGGCEGGTSSAPTAEPGNLCVYMESEEGAPTGQTLVTSAGLLLANVESPGLGAGRTGALLVSAAPTPAGAVARGDWVVTAP